jgi:two-component system NtrC family sensor kinase
MKELPTLELWKELTTAVAEPMLLLTEGHLIASNPCAAPFLAKNLPAQEFIEKWEGGISRTKIHLDGSNLVQVNLHPPTRDEELEGAYHQLEELVDKRTEQLRTSNRQLHNELVEKVRAQEELQKKQVELVHTGKLAALGQMAAGITHEINNPLAYVSSNLDVLVSYLNSIQSLVKEYRLITSLAEQMPTSGLTDQVKKIRDLESSESIDYLLKDIEELVQESREGTGRVAEIIRGLKSYSRMDNQNLRESDIQEGIESSLKILSQELRSRDCEVEKKFGEIPPVRCYPGQLNQVFLNLLFNAAQATESGGKIVISTTVSGEDVVIAIKDNGPGISKKELSQIFDPFFTTKLEDGGTGLGLSISKKIIEDHHGEIGAISSKGNGTTFTITIPIDPQPEEE